MDSAIDSALFLQPSSNCCHLLLSASALHFDEFAVFEISERLPQRLWENHENTSRYFWWRQSLVISPLTTATRQLGNSPRWLCRCTCLCHQRCRWDVLGLCSLCLAAWQDSQNLARFRGLYACFAPQMSIKNPCDSSNFQDFPMAMWRVSIPVVLRPVIWWFDVICDSWNSSSEFPYPSSPTPQGVWLHLPSSSGTLLPGPEKRSFNRTSPWAKDE